MFENLQKSTLFRKKTHLKLGKRFLYNGLGFRQPPSALFFLYQNLKVFMLSLMQHVTQSIEIMHSESFPENFQSFGLLLLAHTLHIFYASDSASGDVPDSTCNLYHNL